MKVAFTASDAPDAQDGLARLTRSYPHVAPEEADVVVALGGDGYMLQMLHHYMGTNKPIYGMNCGTVGFLMNDFRTEGLMSRLENAEEACVHPLEMTATTKSGETVRALAINEVSLLRETRQAAKIRVSIDGTERLKELICDGILLSTPAGSTAYNLSAHGPIIPIDADILALTPISAFRPRRWRGALLPHNAQVRFELLEADKRPVSAVADMTEVRDVVDVSVREDRETTLRMLFDKGHNLAERVLREQFVF